MQNRHILGNNAQYGNLKSPFHVFHGFHGGIHEFQKQGQPDAQQQTGARSHRQVNSHIRLVGRNRVGRQLIHFNCLTGHAQTGNLILVSGVQFLKLVQRSVIITAGLFIHGNLQDVLLKIFLFLGDGSLPVLPARGNHFQLALQGRTQAYQFLVQLIPQNSFRFQQCQHFGMPGADVLGFQIFLFLELIGKFSIGLTESVRTHSLRIQQVGTDHVIQQLVVGQTLQFLHIGSQFLFPPFKIHGLRLGIPEFLFFHAGRQGAAVFTVPPGRGQVGTLRNQLFESHHFFIDGILLFPKDILQALDGGFHQTVFAHFTVLLVRLRHRLGDILHQFGVRTGNNDVHKVRGAHGGHLDHVGQISRRHFIRHPPFRGKVQFSGYHFKHFGGSQHGILHGNVVGRHVGSGNHVPSPADIHHRLGQFNLKLAGRPVGGRHQESHYHGNDQHQKENKKDFLPAIF